MERADAEEFAASWAEAWNSHDLDRVLSHFAEDVEFSSPFVPILANKSNPLHGRAELGAYWTKGLARNPELHFEVLGVFVGAGAIGIVYRNNLGRQVTEALLMGPDRRAYRGWALYGPNPEQ